MDRTPPLPLPAQDAHLAALLEHLPFEINCPLTYFTVEKRTDRLSHFTSSFPMAWQREYRALALHRTDPLVAYAVQSVAPFSWAEAPAPKADAMGALYQRLLKQCGLMEGYTFVVHDPRQRMGLLSLFNRECDPGFERQIQRCKGALQMALVAFHSRMNSGVSGTALEQPLTPREHSILGWVVIGKSYGEISCICDISERTVKFHMANIVRKLDVHTAKQAVFEATRRGLA